jgi:prophage tail gpP-like protein
MFKPFVKNVTTGQELLWREIKIKKSLDEICHSLELEIPASERSKVRRHHRLEVRCINKLVNDSDGERLVTTVLVDEVTPSADTGKHSIMVFGRSPARDIIDSTWSDMDDDSDTDNDTNRTFKTIIRQIGKKFNIGCDTFESEGVADPTEIVPHFTFENESPWTKLMDEADQEGFIFTSSEAGNLYLWRVAANTREEPFHITEGINVKSIKWSENGAEQFHKYVVKGGGYEAVEIDDTCPGGRTLTIVIDDPFVDEKKVRCRAETEMRRRKYVNTIVTVPGWGLTDDQIRRLGSTDRKEIYWFCNALIPVKAPSMGLSAELLISEVEYIANADSMGCDITLVNRFKYCREGSL